MRGPALALALLVVLGAALHAAAQVPTPPTVPSQQEGSPVRQLLQVGLDVITPPQEVPLLGQGVYEVVVEDRSADRAPDGQGLLHYILLDLVFNTTQPASGWSAFLGNPVFQSQGGTVHRTTLTVVPGATVQGQYYRVSVRATMYDTGGNVVTDEQEVVTKLRPFSFATVDLPGSVPNVGPFEEAFIPVLIGNAGQFPDTFLLHAEGPPGWFVQVQPQLTLFPGEERTVQVHLVSPADRVFVPQESATILVYVTSELDPSVVYDRAMVVVLEGTFLPGYWVPLLLLGAVLAAAAGQRAVEGGRRRAKEQGRPHAPELTPAQAVLLADLKKRDPQRYQAMVERRRGAMKARERAYLAVRGKRAALERMLVDQQRAKVRAEKAQEKAAERERQRREAELERQRSVLEREKARREAALAAEQRREEQRRAREEERLRRQEEPMRRAAERERKRREALLRRELAKKQRLREQEERRQRIALEKRMRILERQRKQAQAKARRRGAPTSGDGDAPAKPRGGLFGRRKPPAGGEGGEGVEGRGEAGSGRGQA